MIHILARLVYRQVCAPKEGIRDEPDPPPPCCPNVEPPFSISRPRSSAQASSSGMETLAVGSWPEPPAQALVVLFTELAQRCVQAAPAQEEIHEYCSYHHSSSRTDSIRLCTAIDPQNEHQESTERQYRLQERALELGWPPTAIAVIDEDQGRSGAALLPAPVFSGWSPKSAWARSGWC
ncbi:hypothetical protein KSC_027590 [Ktedonobacter sp. SOSP1-52]|nr:hypothetical protein KSC_027590 [Ktedonobacter sp. SOSP1-52]